MTIAKVWLGPAGIPGHCKGGGSVGGIKCVAELGLNAMEVEFVRGVHMNLKMAEECGKAAKEFGVRLSVHAPYYINLLSKNKEIIEASKKRILDSVERAHLMHADIVAFHAGYYTGLAKQDALEIVKKNCDDMTDVMKSSGWLDVKLGLETSGKHSAFGYLDDLLAVNEENKQCVPVLDFAHIFAKNYGKIDYGEIFDKMKKFDHLHTHFSGIEYTDKGERMHTVMASNKPPFEPLAAEILRRKLSITIISESPITDIDSLAMKKIFENFGHGF
jgi:deoxyribonuclease-4